VGAQKPSIAANTDAGLGLRRRQRVQQHWLGASLEDAKKQPPREETAHERSDSAAFCRGLFASGQTTTRKSTDGEQSSRSRSGCYVLLAGLRRGWQ